MNDKRNFDVLCVYDFVDSDGKVKRKYARVGSICASRKRNTETNGNVEYVIRGNVFCNTDERPRFGIRYDIMEVI